MTYKLGHYLELGLEDLQAELERHPTLHNADELNVRSLEVGLQEIDRCCLPVGMEQEDLQTQPDGITELVETQVSLEAIAKAIPEQGGFRLAAMAMEGLCLGLESQGQAAQSLAQAKNLNQAQEAISERAAELLDTIKDRLVKAADYLTEQYGVVKRGIDKVESTIKELESAMEAMEKDSARFGAVKPEEWFTHLCLLEGGFDEGLKVIPARATDALQKHGHMVASSIGQYVDWVVKVQNNESKAVFDSLKFDPKDFLIDGQKRFDQSVGLKSPSKGQVFYKTTDLGGGKAYYVETSVAPHQGLEALVALGALKFFMAQSNPHGYKDINLKLTALVALPATVWLASVAPPLGIAAGWGIAEWMRRHEVEGSGQVVKIDPDLLFPCLKPDEMKALIAQAKKSVEVMKAWSAQVIQKPWKNAHFDDLVKRIYSKDHDGRENEKLMRTYIGAVVDLMVHVDCGIFEHTRDTLLASLRYGIKSAKQYR